MAQKIRVLRYIEKISVEKYKFELHEVDDDGINSEALCESGEFVVNENIKNTTYVEEVWEERVNTIIDEDINLEELKTNLEEFKKRISKGE